MLLSQRLLYVTAFDRIEEAVTAQVAELAKALGAVVHPTVCSGTRGGLLSRVAGDDAGLRDKLEGVAERLRGMRVRVGDTLMVRGNPAAAAMEAAERVDADYIVIGAGEDCLDRPEAVGESARSLARDAPQHVWIAKPWADAALQHVLCPFDGSRGCADGIRLSLDLCRQFNARLQLLSVLKPPHEPLFGGPEVERNEAEEAARRALRDQREAFLEGFNFDGVTLAREYVWAERASEAIRERAGIHRDGLTVMGVAGRRRFPTMMLGRTAERVLDGSESSLLLVK